MYQGNAIGSFIGGLSCGVPSDIRGLEYLHDKYGVSFLTHGLVSAIIKLIIQSLPWAAVVNPAIHVARYGFPGM
jgi:gamma-glutamyltranspeptidase/glutathione hydrolase